MMARLASLLLLGAISVFGQLELLRIPGPGLEESAGEFIDFGSLPAGDQRDVRLRLRNQGESTIVLERLRVTGSGFAIDGNPSLPYSVAAGTNVDFRVRFKPNGQGSYSGTLRINDTYVMLFGSATASMTLLVEEGGILRQLASGDIVVFGRAQKGKRLSRRFHVENPATEPMQVYLFSVGGGPFSLADTAALPATLAPGASAVFEVEFAPESAGILQGLLTLNDRTVILEGVGVHPPFPEIEVILDNTALQSGQQAAVRLQLDGPSPAAGTGSLSMRFTPARTDTADDPAIFFVENSARTLPLSVSEGKAEVLVAGNGEAWFQTGTTAGSITFIAELGERYREVGVTMPDAPVMIESAHCGPSNTGLDLGVSGFDNTRSVEEVTFLFFDTSGNALTEQPIRVNVAPEFRGYYSRYQIGGVFALKAEFPVAGDVSLVSAVEVQFRSSPGPSETRRIQIQ